jgi:general secretion pathway protein D
MFRSITQVSLPKWMLALQLVLAVGAVRAEEAGFTLNLRDADVRELIATVSEITGRNFIVDPRVSGKVTVISASPMDRTKIYETFLATLNVSGFLAVPSGDVVKIVPNVAAITTAPAGKAVEAEVGDAVVTRIITVKHLDVRQLLNDLRPLLPQNAHVSAHPESNTLVVTDTASNVTRLREIVAGIDHTDTKEIEVVSVRHANVVELAKVFSGLSQGSRQPGEPSIGATAVAAPHTNSLVISGSPGERKMLRTLIGRLDRPPVSIGNTEVITLKNAVAKDLVKVLQGVGDQQMKKGGGEPSPAARFDVQAEEGSNSLIVTAPPDIMTDLRKVVEKLDVRRLQVHVEGIIAEISTDRALELGVEWRSAIPSTGVGGTLRTPVPDGATSRLPGSGGGVEGLVGDGLTLYYMSGGNLRALLKALKQDAGTNILSTPSVVTLDNQKAVIHVGQNVPVLTGQYQTPSSGNLTSLPYQIFERRDVGIKLTVVPQITEGDTVRLEIRQEVSNVVPDTQSESLVTNERTIETTVLVDNGQIIALGGLVADDLQQFETGVPLLGDIPLIGEAFKTRRNVAARKNLMIFLRPTILRDAAKADALTEARYGQVRDAQVAEQQKRSLFVPGNAQPALPPYPPAPNLPVTSPVPEARSPPNPVQSGWVNPFADL